MAATNPYATAALIRGIDDFIADTAEWDDDDTLEEYGEAWANPLVDAALGGTFSVPLDSDDMPEIVANVAAMLTAAAILAGQCAQHVATKPEKAKLLEERANAILEKIVSGEYTVVGLSRTALARGVVSNVHDSPDTNMVAEREYVGRRVLKWRGRTEARVVSTADEDEE
jgi:hypothetical protein